VGGGLLDDQAAHRHNLKKTLPGKRNNVLRHLCGILIFRYGRAFLCGDTPAFLAHSQPNRLYLNFKAIRKGQA
jgi:hypothetical protein